MKRITLWLAALSIVFAGGALARPLLAPATATAAPSQQGFDAGGVLCVDESAGAALVGKNQSVRCLFE